MMYGNNKIENMETIENLSTFKYCCIEARSSFIALKNNLDYWCQGNQTLSEALEGRDVKLEAVNKEFEINSSFMNK